MKSLLNKILLIVALVLLSLFLYQLRDPVVRLNFISLLTISDGDRYYRRLQTWNRLAQNGNWSDAARVEKYLDPVDIAVYKSAHQPEELKKLINTLVLKPNKTVEDWLELARVQSQVGKDKDAADSVTKAHEMDPVREDITKLYYQLTK